MSNPNYSEMQDTLMHELRLYHFPVAVKYLFSEDAVEDFRSNVDHYEPIKPTTFCQWEIGARMKGQTILGRRETLGCQNAAYVFGWNPHSEKEVESHLKYVKDLDQADRFLRSKPRLEENKLEAVVVSPLAESYFEPDTVHFYCDNMQAYHLLVDYMSAMDQHPLTTSITMNSSACAGNIYSLLNKQANFLPACSGSYNAGKTERGEVNVVIPGEHIGPAVQRLMERKAKYGSSSVTRPGDNFPGADVCKNCPLIIYKKAKKNQG